MNINGLFAIVEEFFDTLHPNICHDYLDDSMEFDLWNICEAFFQHIGPQM